jgi:RNA polymerase sigma-70 factor (ECF subfamily)
VSAVVDRRTSAVASGPLRPTDDGHEGYDVYGAPPDDDGYGYDDDHDMTVAAPLSGRPRRGPMGRLQLRADFGAHFEDNYQRLVAQLFAITLNSGEAHEVVQDAYSRAWRQWATIGRLRDPAEWIRRVAVRSTIRSWRRQLARIGFGRPQPIDDDAVEPRTAVLLSALARLSIGERRAIVLHHMVGWSIAEIAVVERSSPGSVSVRLARAAHVVGRALPDLAARYEDEYDPVEGEEQW